MSYLKELIDSPFTQMIGDVRIKPFMLY